MMTPSLFHDNFDLFDRFYQDPWFGLNDHEFKNLEKKFSGKTNKKKRGRRGIADIEGI